jgi:prevent-host-death family protein
MAAVSVYNARAEFSRLIERALRGEEIVITRRGKPAMRCVGSCLCGAVAEGPPSRSV